MGSCARQKAPTSRLYGSFDALYLKCSKAMVVSGRWDGGSETSHVRRWRPHGDVLQRASVRNSAWSARLRTGHDACSLSAGWFAEGEASLDTQSRKRIARIVHQAARRRPHDTKVFDFVQGRLQKARISRGKVGNGRRRWPWWKCFIISWSG